MLSWTNVRSWRKEIWRGLLGRGFWPTRDMRGSGFPRRKNEPMWTAATWPLTAWAQPARAGAAHRRAHECFREGYARCRSNMDWSPHSCCLSWCRFSWSNRRKLLEQVAPSEQGEINFPVSPLHGHRMGRHFGGHVAATISRDGGSQRGNIHNSARQSFGINAAHNLGHFRNLVIEPRPARGPAGDLQEPSRFNPPETCCRVWDGQSYEHGATHLRRGLIVFAAVRTRF